MIFEHESFIINRVLRSWVGLENWSKIFFLLVFAEDTRTYFLINT